jgi:hypothetical protein
VKSALIADELVVCDERGLAVFDLLRHDRQVTREAYLIAFNLVDLDGARRSSRVRSFFLFFFARWACGASRRAVSPHAQSNTTTVVLERCGCGTKSATRMGARQCGQNGTSVERFMTFDARGFRATRFSAQLP